MIVMPAPGSNVLGSVVFEKKLQKLEADNKINFLEVPGVGNTLKKDEIFGTIEAVKTVSNLFLPVGGTIVEMNPALQGQPELVNKDPYGEGWVIRLRISDASELDKLLAAAAYSDLVG
jgi:glycine cleavage system H protein